MDAGPAKALTVGELIDMQWKLGVAVESSDGISNQPFVSILVRVKDSDGKLASRAFDLSLKEFQVCILESLYSPVSFPLTHSPNS